MAVLVSVVFMVVAGLGVWAINLVQHGGTGSSTVDGIMVITAVVFFVAMMGSENYSRTGRD